MSDLHPGAPRPGTSGAGEAEAAVSRVLWQASHAYGDLPEQVAGRLDRVLDALPAADTLHSAPARESRFERWAERLRPRRVRYAILSASAAVVITVVALAGALQFVGAETGGLDGGSMANSEEHAEGEGAPAPGAAPETGADTDALADDEFGEREAGVDGIVNVEAFATGSDYQGGADLLAALRDLGDSSVGTASGAVPEELAGIAAGGALWRACEEAIAARFDGLLVAVDFARFESEPAIMALLVSDEGDTAVALSPACGEGIIEALAVQP